MAVEHTHQTSEWRGHVPVLQDEVKSLPDELFGDGSLRSRTLAELSILREVFGQNADCHHH